jgi:hypothetical protein
MDHLTEDMTRLRGEIGSMRRARDSFRRNMECDVAAIQAGVTAMLEGFRTAHAEMARDSRAERMASVSSVRRSVRDLKRNVAGLRKGFVADIRGAHQAWVGGSFFGQPTLGEPRRRMEPSFRAKYEKAGPQKNHKKHSSR